MAKYINGDWIVGYEPPELPKFKIGQSFILLGQKVFITKIKPIHSVSGPVGCLLWRDKELPDEWFHFCGYMIYFDRPIYLYSYGGKKENYVSQNELDPNNHWYKYRANSKMDFSMIEYNEEINLKDFFNLD